jgi:hypothetical protein
MTAVSRKKDSGIVWYEIKAILRDGVRGVECAGQIRELELEITWPFLRERAYFQGLGRVGECFSRVCSASN